MVIVNIAMSYLIKLHGEYVFFFSSLLVASVIEHQGRCSPKGEGFVTTLVKNPCKNIKPRSWDMYSKLNGGKNILVGVHFGYYG